eukprot:5836075-Amphidinium_carterae.1
MAANHTVPIKVAELAVRMLELGPDAFKRELFEKLATVRRLAKELRLENDSYIAAMPTEVKE